MAFYNRKPNSGVPEKTQEQKALAFFTDSIIVKLKEVQNDWKKPWFTAGESGLQWPVNVDGRQYNGQNAIFLLWQQERKGYQLPVYMTFERLSKLNFDGKDGRNPLKDKDGNPLPRIMVNKGEKSTPVMFN